VLGPRGRHGPGWPNQPNIREGLLENQGAAITVVNDENQIKISITNLSDVRDFVWIYNLTKNLF
jgi:hypothetical protein